MVPVRKILFPTDFSECAEYAFRLACALAWDYGAELLVVHIVEHEDQKAYHAADGYQQKLENQLRRLLPPECGVPVDYCVAHGNPATEILRLAADNSCDLIVIGTHGRAGLNHLLRGSVAEQVVRKANCPVVTIKLPENSGNRNFKKHSDERMEIR